MIAVGVESVGQGNKRTPCLKLSRVLSCTAFSDRIAHEQLFFNARQITSGVRKMSNKHWHINHWPIWVRLVGGIWLMVVIASVAMMFWLYSDQVRTTEQRARQQAENVHQMTMASITAMMLTGTMSERTLYLDQVRNVQDINDLRVLPSKSVIKMFGPGVGEVASSDEQKVLDSGTAFFHHDSEREVLTAILPAKAASNYLGKDCLGCHNAKEGEVLGIVSMKISLQEAALATKRYVMNLALMIAAGLLVITLTIVAFIRSVIGTPLNQAVTIANAIAHDRMDNVIEPHSDDEMGQLLAALSLMQSNLIARIDAERKVAMENQRIRIALDGSATPMVLTDERTAIIYMNTAATTLLAMLLPSLKGRLSVTRVTELFGRELSALFDGSQAREAFQGDFNTVRKLDLALAERNLRITLAKVRDKDGRHIGCATQWQDRTNEVSAEHEISEIVAAANQGQLTLRIPRDGKEGFFLVLSDGINGFLETTRQALEETSEVLNRLSNGDLTQEIEGDYRGIFADLQTDTNATIAQLRTVIGLIKDSARTIDESVRDIASGNMDLSQRTETQARSLEEVSNFMGQLNTTVRKNAERARDVNEMARKSAVEVKQGQAAVQRVVGTMHDIDVSAKRIVDIIGIIDSIAFQTNILALNAAVESARAGEHGRSFAVVASEVRQLAQRSATAANEVKTLITDASSRVESGTQLAKQAETIIEQVANSFQSVANLVTEISVGNHAQSQGIERMTGAVAQIEEATQQNAALVEQAASSAKSLGDEAEKLVSVVNTFVL